MVAAVTVTDWPRRLAGDTDFHRAVRLCDDRRSNRCAVVRQHADRLPGKRIPERIGHLHARSVFAVAPSATEPSLMTTRSAICAVLTSAINVTFWLRLLLLMLAVTVLAPAVWLVTLISTVPSGSVMTVGQPLRRCPPTR